MHHSLLTNADGGAVRMSPGFATSIEDIDAVVAALQEVVAAAVK
jgi:selenocysteine lyase/cysteine desulfurase